MKRQLFLVAYDVCNHQRLRYIHQILKDYASGGQKSAFECYLTAGEKRELESRIQQIMEPSEDAFLIIQLLSRDAVETLGKAIKPVDQLYTYLG